MIAVVAAAVTACGTTIEGVATAPSSVSSSSAPPVPVGLDTSGFRTDPAPVGQEADSVWIVEGNRMLEQVVLPSEVDPGLAAEVPGQEAAPALHSLEVTAVPEGLRSPLSRMKVGVSVARADRPTGSARELRVGLYRFHDSAVADQVLDSEGYEQRGSPRVTVPGVSGAAAVESAPGVVDAFVSVESLVVHVHARARDTAAAAELAGRTFARQLPALRAFTPTPEGALRRVPVDPAGVLRRTVAETTAPEDVLRWIGALTVPMYERRVADPEGVQRLRAAGVDAVGWNVGRVYRARDEAAARGLRPDRARNPSITPAVGVPQLGDAVGCYTRAGGDPFCELVVGRYYAWVPAGDLDFARRAAAAQWVILTRNP